MPVSWRPLGRTNHLSRVFIKSDTLVGVDIVDPFPESKTWHSHSGKKVTALRAFVKHNYVRGNRLNANFYAIEEATEQLFGFGGPAPTSMQQHCQSHYELLTILTHVLEDTHAGRLD